jgi:hypothetical protein
VRDSWNTITALESPKYFNQLPEMFGVLTPLFQ